MLAIGIDLGATKTNFGLIEIKKEKFRIIKTNTIPSPQEKEQLKEAILENVEKIIDKRVEKIGLALAGQIDLERQKSILSPNIKALERISLGEILKKEFKRPVFVDNDANAFVLAETTYGAASGKQKVVGLTLGTGIGGGVMIRGKIYHGAYTSATELGHMIIKEGGRKCSCGKRGCLEAYSSATAIIEEYRRRSGLPRDAYSIQEEAEAGLEPGKSILEEAAYYLAIGLSNIIVIFEPEIIILGGGLSRVTNFVNRAIKNTKIFTRKIPSEYVKIVKAKLGTEAGMIGAALLGYNSALS